MVDPLHLGAAGRERVDDPVRVAGAQGFGEGPDRRAEPVDGAQPRQGERGVCGQLRAGDTLGALNALSKARDRAPADPKPLNLAGIIYGKRGETEKLTNSASVLIAPSVSQPW